MNPEFARIVHGGACLNRLLVAAAVLLLASAFCSQVHAAPAPTPQQQADRSAIVNFPLSMDVVDRLEKVIEAGNAAHLPCMNDSASNWRSLDAIADQLKTKEPRALPILARYGFTPKEFVTAFMAVANTEFAAAMLEHPDSPFAKGIKKDHGYNDKNVAFFQAHRAQITAAMKKINDDSACGR